MNKRQIPTQFSFTYKFIDSPDADKRLKKLFKLLAKNAPKKESLEKKYGAAGKHKKRHVRTVNS